MKKRKHWEVRIKKTRQMHRRTQKNQVLAILNKMVRQTLQMDSLTQFRTRMTKTERTGRTCRIRVMTDALQPWRIVKRPCRKTQKLLGSILLHHSDIMTLVAVEVVEVEAVVEDVAEEVVIKIKDEVVIKMMDEVAKEVIKIAAVIITIRITIVAVDTRTEVEEVAIRMIDVVDMMEAEVGMEEAEVGMVMAVTIIQKVNGDITTGEAMEGIATEEKTNEVVTSRAIIQAEVAMGVSSMAKEKPFKIPLAQMKCLKRSQMISEVYFQKLLGD